VDIDPRLYALKERFLQTGHPSEPISSEEGQVQAAVSAILREGEEWEILLIKRAEAEGVTIETVNSPAERIEIDDGLIDVVTCKQLLHECHDVDEVLREIYRVLTPRGRAFVIDFDADGSRLAAWSIRMFIRLTQGREEADVYNKSFRAGLSGNTVREKMMAVGFASVQYIKSGPNYLMIGSRS
jgi:ubiquinone/menaquinone biosynthesis C-methylase UbiE